jgi:hypothetical protein
VAITMSTWLMLPFLEAHPGTNRELLVLAMGEGSLIFFHLNDFPVLVCERILGNECGADPANVDGCGDWNRCGRTGDDFDRRSVVSPVELTPREGVRASRSHRFEESGRVPDAPALGERTGRSRA